MANNVKRNRGNSTSKTKNGELSKIKFSESYTSLILGAIVVLIVGILIVVFVRGNVNTQTSSDKDEISAEEQEALDFNASSTYTIKVGDDLWSISENVYKDGYKWVEIAKANKLENPGLIHAGNKLVIPTVSPSPVVTEPTLIPMESEINNSIAGDTYTIRSGDNLWNIAIRAYGDGFKWPDIAKVNNLENPDLIFSGNTLNLPR